MLDSDDVDSLANQWRSPFAELEGTYSNCWLTTLMLDPEVIKINYLHSELDYCIFFNTSKTFPLVDQLARENIEARLVWKPPHPQLVFEGCKFYSLVEDEFVSERLFAEGLHPPSG